MRVAPSPPKLSRRHLLAAGLAAMPLTHARAAEPPPPPELIPPELMPLAGKQIWVIGDSMAGGLADLLGPRLKPVPGLQLTRNTRPATGLARPDFFDWSAELDRMEAIGPAPQAVLWWMGQNDAQGFPVKPKPILWGTPAWRAEYLARVGAVMDRFQRLGAPLLWLGLPIVRQASFAAKLEVLNAVYQEAAASHSNVSYLSTWELFRDEGGAYAAAVKDAGGRTQPVRTQDGIHFTPRGYGQIADLLLPKLAALAATPATPAPAAPTAASGPAPQPASPATP